LGHGILGIVCDRTTLVCPEAFDVGHDDMRLRDGKHATSAWL